MSSVMDKGFLNEMLGPAAADVTRYFTYAGAALAGGALYYYLNNQGPQPVNLTDYSNQTREIEVLRFAYSFDKPF